VIKFFRHQKKKTPSEQPIELFMDVSTYEQLKKRAQIDGISEDDALLRSLEQGMHSYWLHMAKVYQEDYEVVNQLHERYKRDNDLLKGIMIQNERFYEILAGREAQNSTEGEKR